MEISHVKASVGDRYEIGVAYFISRCHMSEMVLAFWLFLSLVAPEKGFKLFSGNNIPLYPTCKKQRSTIMIVFVLRV